MAEPTDPELAALGLEDDDELSALGLEDDPQPTQAPPVTKSPAPVPDKGGHIWATLKAAGELSGLVPHGVIPDERTARGALATGLNGYALQWADELAGLQSEQKTSLENMRGLHPRGEQVDPRWAYRNGRDKFRAVESDFRAAHPAAAFALSMGGSMMNPVGALASEVTGPMAAAPWLAPRMLWSAPATGAARLIPTAADAARYAPAAVEGAIAGAGSTDEAEGMGEAAAIGAPLSAAGQMAGEVLGGAVGLGARRISDAAARRVADAGTKAQEMAAEKVAGEIASAKGKLGSATQEANRALENLLRLESTGGLSQEQSAVLASLRQSGVIPALEAKLADSMLEQVPGAAGRVDMSRAALEGLTGNAQQATDEAASEILSGAEAKRQIGERAKRYLPTIIGAAAGADGKGLVGGALAGYALGGTPGSAFVGGLSGSALRPALRAVGRMAQHPAVQRAVFEPLEAGAERVGQAAMSALPPAAAAAERTWRAGVERGGDEKSTSAVVEALATQNPEALGPYAQQIQQAAADGNLPLVHYTLQQTDPKYRAMIEAARNGDTQ